MNKKTLSIIATLILGAAAAILNIDVADITTSKEAKPSGEITSSPSSKNTPPNTDAIIEDAFKRKLSDLQVEGQGKVIRILIDDTKGSQHQRFLLELESGLTLLVAHNIDLAPRVKNLREGDIVRFYGEYEWNDRGGVIHWTHHDPAGRHVGGWLEHHGNRYE